MQTKDKYILFVRHGLTEMNERLETMPWYSENFVDAALWDTRLSEKGVQQAKDVHDRLMEEACEHFALHKMEVLLSSPLTRALHTAELVFNYKKRILPHNIPQIAHPLLRERLYLSSEVGRSGCELKTEFKGWDFSTLPVGEPWWYVHPRSEIMTGFAATSPIKSTNSVEEGPDRHSITEVMDTAPPPNTATTNNIFTVESLTPPAETLSDRQSTQFTDINSTHQIEQKSEQNDPYTYVEWRPRGTYCCEGEPSDAFLERIIQLKEYLQGRPEQYIAVVAHWGVIRALTGLEFANCEMKLVKTSDFLTHPNVSDE